MLRLFQRRPTTPPTAHVDISHGGEVFRVALKRLASSRRFTLRVRAATRDVVLTMPERSSTQSAREFAERHAAWIGVRLARLPKPVSFEPRSVMPLRGVDHRIVHCPSLRGVVWVDADESGRAAFGLGLLKGDEANIEQYVTGKALDGLFLMIAEEEKKIRKDPVGTGSAILKKVFGGL